MVERSAIEKPAAGVLAYSTVHAAARDNAQSWLAMSGARSGLRPNALAWCELACWIGAVEDIDAVSLPADLRIWDCRNHHLAWLALQRNGFTAAVKRAIGQYGAPRIAVLLGTSTSGIRSSELAYARYLRAGHWPDDYDFRHQHSLDALCRFCARVLGLHGPMATLSTACSSSAKVFATAQQWLACGLIDAAVVGGVDSLCLSTLHGFDALQLLAPQACRPFDAARNGISIGEAAGFVLLSRDAAAITLAGCGESSDAWHMSTPHPEGLGAQEAMRAALAAARLAPSEIGYVNAHGTATPTNDRAENAAMRAVFGAHAVPVSSTKGVTGHTLGAAGVTEAIVVIQTLEQQVLPPSANLDQLDPALALDVVQQPRAVDLRYAMTNSFGFGGSNCSLIFARSNLR